MRMTPGSLFCAGLLIVFCLLIVLAGCDDNPSEPSGPGGDDQPPEVTGTWEMTTVITANTCGLPDSTSETETVGLVQDGDVFSITRAGNHWGVAELDGRNLHILATKTSAELGYTAVFATEGTGVVSETEITGSFTTDVRFKPDVVEHTDCEITSSFVMTRPLERIHSGR